MGAALSFYLYTKYRKQQLNEALETHHAETAQEDKRRNGEMDEERGTSKKS